MSQRLCHVALYLSHSVSRHFYPIRENSIPMRVKSALLAIALLSAIVCAQSTIECGAGQCCLQNWCWAARDTRCYSDGEFQIDLKIPCCSDGRTIYYVRNETEVCKCLGAGTETYTDEDCCSKKSHKPDPLQLYPFCS